MDTQKGGLLALVLLYLAGVALTLLLVTSSAYGPIHFNDEVRYWNIAHALFSGTFTVEEFHHSPPLYAIALLPALALFPAANVYDVAKVINVLWITSLVFPVYLLMRQFAGRKFSLLIAALVLLLPAQVVMPRLIMSENLFYPLMLWAVYLAFTNVLPANHKWKLAESIGFGLLCGLLIISRYLALPLVPMLFIIWWLKPLDAEKPPLLISKKKVLHAVAIFLPFVLVVGTWVLLGLRENVPAYRMIGFGVADNPNPAQLGRRRFVMWASFYLSYFALMLAPYLSILAVSVFHIRLFDWKNKIARWLVAVALISASFLITATRHSWRARYNYPEPETIQGRYIFYLAPLFLIALFAVLKIVKLPRLSRSGYLLTVILIAELVIAAYLNIFHGFILLDRPMRLSLNSPDGYLFQSLGIGYPVIALLFLIITTRLIGRQRLLLRIFPLALASMLLIGNVMLYQSILKPMQAPNYQIDQLVRRIDATYAPEVNIRGEPVVLFVPYEKDTDNCGIWRATLRFHGFQSVKCELGHGDARNQPEVFIARVGSHAFTVKLIKESNFNPDRPNQFTFNGKYYLISTKARE